MECATDLSSRERDLHLLILRDGWPMSPSKTGNTSTVWTGGRVPHVWILRHRMCHGRSSREEAYTGSFFGNSDRIQGSPGAALSAHQPTGRSQAPSAKGHVPRDGADRPVPAPHLLTSGPQETATTGGPCPPLNVATLSTVCRVPHVRILGHGMDHRRPNRKRITSQTPRYPPPPPVPQTLSRQLPPGSTPNPPSPVSSLQAGSAYN